MVRCSLCWCPPSYRLSLFPLSFPRRAGTVSCLRSDWKPGLIEGSIFRGNTGIVVLSFNLEPGIGSERYYGM